MFSKIGIKIIALAVLATGGFFVWQRLAPTPAPQLNEIVKTPAPKDETLGWETYANEAFKFELKHPKELQFKYEAVSEPRNGGKSILTLPFGDSPFKVLVVTNAPAAAPNPKDGNIIENKIISVGGATTTEKVFKGTDSEIVSVVSFEKNNIFYAIWAEITGDTAERLKIFDLMLSTFKILE